MRVGIIYKAISPSGKVYVGQTICGLENRKRHHECVAQKNHRRGYYFKFHHALRKYGEQKFVWEIIHDNVPQANLDLFEIWHIALCDSFNNGYNATEGGGNRKPVSYKTREKQSIAHMGKSNNCSGRKYSEKTKVKMRESHLGKTPSKETRAKMSRSQIGRKHSEESKQKISKSRKEKYCGENSPSAKLTSSDVLKIRKEYVDTKITYEKLASKYSVKKSTIQSIISRRSWRHI